MISILRPSDRPVVTVHSSVVIAVEEWCIHQLEDGRASDWIVPHLHVVIDLDMLSTPHLRQIGMFHERGRNGGELNAELAVREIFQRNGVAGFDNGQIRTRRPILWYMISRSVAVGVV